MSADAILTTTILILFTLASLIGWAMPNTKDHTDD